jgi:hypothetical protein
MAIALANQSAGLIGAPASAWTYTTGFTPTVGRQMVVFVLTPQASGASAYCWTISGPVDNFRCVGTRSGVSGSYNISAWVGTVNSTSTSIGMFFSSTAVHGIIVAEFSGWTNLSPVATLTNTTTFTAGTPFSGVAAPGGRDLATTGTNNLQIRSVLGFNPATLSNLSPTATGAVSDISISGTPATTLTSAPGGSTWFQNPNIPNSATGTSLVSTVAAWTTGPSGGQMAAFTMATGSLLNGQSGTWTQLTNPVGIANTLVRICYRLGTSLNGATNTYTASASSTINAASIILGEKSLVTRTASSSDTASVSDSPYAPFTAYSTLTYNVSLGLWQYSGTPAAGDASFYVRSLSDTVANAAHAIFTNGTSTLVPIAAKAINDAGNGYEINLNGVVPTVGGQTSWPTITLIDFPNLQQILPRSLSQGLSFSDTNASGRAFFNTDSISFNYPYGPVEFSSDPSVLTQAWEAVYNDTTPDQYRAPIGIATSGDSILYVISNNFDWFQSGMQMILAGADGSIVGPLNITGGGEVIDLFGNPNGALYIYVEPNVPTGSQSISYFRWAYLIPATVTFQDFVNAMAVVPQAIGTPDPTDGSSPPFLGGLV